MLTAFPASLWGLVLLWAGTNTVLFMSLVHFYRKVLQETTLVRDGVSKWDVFFKVVSTLTEPDEFDIFPVWSTGGWFRFRRLFIEDRRVYLISDY